MTTKYRVTFTSGRQATMLDMEDRGLAYAEKSVLERFRPANIQSIEEDHDEDEGRADRRDEPGER